MLNTESFTLGRKVFSQKTFARFAREILKTDRLTLKEEVTRLLTFDCFARETLNTEDYFCILGLIFRKSVGFKISNVSSILICLIIQAICILNDSPFVIRH